MQNTECTQGSTGKICMLLGALDRSPRENQSHETWDFESTPGHILQANLPLRNISTYCYTSQDWGFIWPLKHKLDVLCITTLHYQIEVIMCLYTCVHVCVPAYRSPENVTQQPIILTPATVPDGPKIYKKKIGDGEYDTFLQMHIGCKEKCVLL